MKVISPSATLKMNTIAMQKKRNGERVFNFAAGDPVLANHPKIIESAVNSTKNGFCPYPPVAGIPEIRSLCADWMNKSYQTEFSEQNVLVTCGGKYALFSLLYCLLQTNDEVLIQSPYWVSYPDIVAMSGGRVKVVPSNPENGWKITGKDLYNSAAKHSKILLLNNACNPTGILYTREEIRELLTAAKKLGLLVISDEVYSGIVFEEPGFVSCGSFPEFKENVIIVQSCSKNFAMTGWRVGFVLGPKSIINILTTFQGQTTTGIPLISQWAAVGALSSADQVLDYVKDAMKKRRDLFIKTFNSHFPKTIEKISSAIYAFVSLSSLGIRETNSLAFCEKLIADHNISLVPGIAFGHEGYVRFAFSESEEDIVEGLKTLQKLLPSI